MRNILFSLLSVALMLSACNKAAVPSGASGQGGLRLSLQTQEELADAAVRSNLTDYVAALPAKDAVCRDDELYATGGIGFCTG